MIRLLTGEESFFVDGRSSKSWLLFFTLSLQRMKLAGFHLMPDINCIKNVVSFYYLNDGGRYALL